MDITQTLGVLAGAGWASGVNLYLASAGLGIAGRMGWLELPGTLDTLSHPLVIGAAVLLYLVETVADKIPFVDSLSDAVHTFVRPAGGAAMGYMALGDLGPVMQTIGAMTGGTLALDSHLVKATTRAAINTSPEPFTNIAASVTEDAAVVGVLWFIINHPVWTAVIVIAFVAFSIWFLRMMWRFVRKLFRPQRPQAPQDAAVQGQSGNAA